MSPDLRKRILKGLKNQKDTSCISYAKSPVRKENQSEKVFGAICQD